jgi:hypothetical protein
LVELGELIRGWEEQNPAGIQNDQLKASMDMSFIVVHFDKVRGVTLQEYPFGADVQRALMQMMYFEEAHRHDLSRETVLLAAAEGVEGLRVTHLRYYHRHGIPPLPDFLTPNRRRPQTDQ